MIRKVFRGHLLLEDLGQDFARSGPGARIKKKILRKAQAKP
jgi:hypothetical protein